MAEYLFPCRHCQQSFTIEVAQAGRTVPCPFCNESQELPKLSEIRRLETTHDETAADHQRTTSQKMGLAQTWMFIAGLPLLLIGGGIGIWQLYKANTMEKEIQQIDTESRLQAVEERIETLNGEELWNVWHDEILENPPGIWEQSAILYGEQQVQVRRLIAYFAVGVGVIGVGLIFASLFTGKRSTPE